MDPTWNTQQSHRTPQNPLAKDSPDLDYPRHLVYTSASSDNQLPAMFFSPVQDLQRPTHPRLRIRDARDAQIVLEAVRSGVLQLVERRLNEGERNMFIRSGAVFVWEESDDEYGLKRWTDGRMWTQSRAREPFLFYEVCNKRQTTCQDLI